MKLVADLHIHSHYSRATSKDLDFEHLWLWAQRKGVQVVGTGDLSHPGWLAEMRDKLEPAEEGLFRLREDAAAPVLAEVPPACRGPVRFMLTGEISNIYKRHGAVRKVHNVVFAPTLDAVARIQAKLETIGNIRSDGRPILGLDSRDLLEIMLEIDPRCYLIPAHIWTPWFSMLGSKSGFDTVEECFGDLSDHIFAVETGLSSDPPMNWRLSMLDRYTLVSNSDAHSPPKLAREATLFDTDLSYDALFAAMRSGDPATFRGTIEFFPEEGKYHHDGHRKCGVSWQPQTTKAHDGRCVVCGKPVTVGVMHRVDDLADRVAGDPQGRAPFHSLIPLPEVVSELLGVGVNSKKVQQEYLRLLEQLGPELSILLDLPAEAIAKAGGPRLAAGILRMRRGEVSPQAGYDGEYGVIRLFDGPERDEETLQIGLFGTALADTDAPENDAPGGSEPTPAAQATRMPDVTAASPQAAAPMTPSHARPVDRPVARALDRTLAEATPGAWAQVDLFGKAVAANGAVHPLLHGLNAEQRAAVVCLNAPVIIAAGPGTGKTRTLTHRIAYLVEAHGVNPESVLAITFTNKAAGEMAARLAALLPPDAARGVTVKTFHALGAQLLQLHHARAELPPNFAIVDDEARLRIMRAAMPELSARQAAAALDAVSAAKNQLQTPDAPELALDFAFAYRRYEAGLAQSGAVDFDDLILRTVQLLQRCPDVLQAVTARFRWISVDEYQDVNHAQYHLLQLLTVGGANLCAIGDPDQAIYGFRGADRRYFFAFADDYPGARILQLSQNYRSVQSILDAAQQVIDKNPDRDALRIWSEFVAQTRLDLYQAPTDKAEAEYVVHQIEQMVGGTSYFSLDSGRVLDDGQGRGFGDFAALYRTSAQSALLVEAFERSGIPYQVVGRSSLFAHADVQRLMAHLWLLYVPWSRVHWETLLHAHADLLNPDALDAFTGAIRAGVAPAEALAAQDPGWNRPTLAYLDAVLRAQATAAQATMAQAGPQASVEELVALLLDAYAGDEHLTLALDDDRRGRLLRRARLHDARLPAFLEAAALESDADTYDPRADRVTLMTLHASKGLEFPVVYMVGCEEGLLPYVRGDAAPSGEAAAAEAVEEERRLFYVGMTRAQEKLVLTHARRRFLFGRYVEAPVSRFVNDIETSLKELRRAERRKPVATGPDHEQLTLF